MIEETVTAEAEGKPAEDASLPTVAPPQSKAGKEIMALKAQAEVMAIIPTTLEEAFRFAQLVVQAGLAPDSYSTGSRPDAQKICIGILAGAEIGVPPMQALKGIAIINRRPAIWGDLAVALVQSKGVLTSFEHLYLGEPGTDDYTCRVIMERKGQTKPYEGKFSIGDAKRAHLWGNASKKPWIEYPDRMLFNRARAFALRDGFADCLAGLAIAEEARDLPPEPEAVDATFLEDAPALEHKLDTPALADVA